MSTLETDLPRALAEIVESDPPSPDLADRLAADVLTSAQPSTPRARFRFGGPLLAAAAVLAVVAGILVATRVGRSAPDTAPVAPPSGPSISAGPPTGAPGTDRSTAPVTPGLTPSAVPDWVTGDPGVAAGLPADLIPLSTWFVDATTGFMLTTGPCDGGGRNCAGILRSTDAAATWSALPALADAVSGEVPAACPQGDGAPQNCVSTVDFTDARHGVLWGPGVLLITDDGGSHWRSVAVADDLVAVARTGQVVVTITGSPNRAGVVRTSTDGARLTLVTGTGAPDGPVSLTRAGARIFAVTNTLDAGIGLASTTDGVQWRREPTPPCALIYTLEGRTDGSILLSCSPLSGEQPSAAVLVAGARSWETLGGSPVAITDSMTSQVVAATDPRHFAVLLTDQRVDGGPANRWAVTSDGGRSWTQLTSDERFPSQQDDVHLLVTADGLLVGVLSTQHLIVTSTDLGATWRSYRTE
ncbi:MAG: hypothetical protein INR72_14750 [Williamsia herbipolensis]|nr:hypothetical protein [Williamsia herbipolensis]